MVSVFSVYLRDGDKYTNFIVYIENISYLCSRV